MKFCRGCHGCITPCGKEEGMSRTEGTKHEMICKILEGINEWARQELIQYVFCREYDILARKSTDQIRKEYEHALKKQARAADKD